MLVTKGVLLIQDFDKKNYFQMITLVFVLKALKLKVRSCSYLPHYKISQLSPH